MEVSPLDIGVTVGQIGVAAVFVWAWMRTEQRLEQANQQLLSLLRESLTAQNNTAEAMRQLREFLTTKSRRGQGG